MVVGELNRYLRIMFAYGTVSIFSLPAGWVGSELLRLSLDYSLHPGLAAGLVWSMFAGIPSLQWARANLERELGIKAPVEIRGVGARGIPVAGGVLADLVGKRRGGPGPGQELRIARSITLQQGRVVVRESEIEKFLNVSWNRQHGGRQPFSRAYWTEGRPERLRRDKYELILTVLIAHGAIEGRGKGASGFLPHPPRRTLAELRHEYGG